MTPLTDHQSGRTPPPRTDVGLDEARIEAGLAELAAAADLLRELPLDDEEPGVAFDPTWSDENAG